MPGKEVYALVVDGTKVFVDHSRVRCVAQATRLIRSKHTGSEMCVVKELPVHHDRNTILYLWRKGLSGWRVVPGAGAV